MKTPLNPKQVIKTLIVDDDELPRQRLRRLLEAHHNIHVVGEARDGLEAQVKIANLKPNLVFMDIDMPFLNGIEVARSLGATKPMIVFVTAFDAYAVHAFEVNATDYLLKPIQSDRLAACSDKVNDLLARGAPYPFETYIRGNESYKRNRKISFVDGKEIVVVNMDDISMITTEGRYSQIFYADKSLLVDESLTQVINRLDKAIFLFAHRNAIVNVNFVKQLKRDGLRKYILIMNPTQKEVAVSRGCLSQIKAAILAH